MPFKSEAQKKYMFAEHPKIAKQWAKEERMKDAPPHHSGKGTRARLNTAAEKYMFGIKKK